MSEKKGSSSLKTKTSLWTKLIAGWFGMYFLGLVVFPIKYPDTDMNGQEYQSFMWLWLQLYLALFGLGHMVKKELKDKINNDG